MRSRKRKLLRERNRLRKLERKRYRQKQRRCAKRRKGGIGRFRLFAAEADCAFFAPTDMEMPLHNPACKQKVVVKKGSLVIDLPRVFDMDTNEAQSLKVLAVFRRALLHHKRINYVDFSRMRLISPACAMVLTSYADMWKSRAPNVQCLDSTWTSEVRKIMSDIGFFDYMGYDKPEVGFTSDPVRYMRIRSFVKKPTVEDVGREVLSFIGDVEKFIGADVNDSLAYKAITEAILNVHHHAYVRARLNHLPKKWWLSVSYDERNHELGLIVYDHGVGIPESMKHSTLFKTFKSKLHEIYGFKRWGDKERLKIAFDRNAPWRNPRLVRQANLPRGRGRGHGCGDILRLVLACSSSRKGRMSVSSGYARYDYSSETGTHVDKAKVLTHKLEGTLIEWKVKL